MTLNKTMRLGLVFLLFFILGCTDRNKTKEQFFKEGLKVLNSNNPSGAIVSFKKALEKDPNFFEARLNLAKAYRELGKLDSSENELQKVARQNPASKDVHIELGKLYLLKDRPDDALKETSGFAGETSGDPDAVEVAAWAYAMKGEYPASVALLKRLLQDKEHGTTAGVSLARVYLRMGDLEGAKAQVAEVLRNSPSDKRALSILGDVQARSGDRDGAIGTYDRVLKDDPANIEAYTRKALLLSEKGNYDQALAVADQLIKKYPKRPEGYRLKGIVSYYKKNFKDATDLLQKSISISQSPLAYYYLGLCRYYNGEPEQAITELQRALDLNPSFTQAGIFSTVILLKKGRTDDAVTEIKKMLSKDDKNALAHNLLGSAYIAKGMYSEGIAELDRAIELDPKAVNFYMQKGQVELNAGKFKEAETALNTAVSVNPEVLQARVALGSYYIKRKEYDKAMKTLQQGIKGQKTDAALYYLMAEACSNGNRPAEAVKYLEKAKEASPGAELAYLTLASIYSKNGDKERAASELKSLLGKAPDSAKANIAMAGICQSKGDEAGALKYYLQAKATGKVEGYNELARYYLKKNQIDDGLRVLDESIRKYPSDIVSYELKGAAFLLRKKYDDALGAFAQIEKANPRLCLALTVNAYVSMGKPEKALDRVGKELQKTPDSIELLAEMSRISMVMKRKQDAVGYAEKIVARDPASPVGYMTLARIYQQDKELDKAVEALKRPAKSTDLGLIMALGNLYLLKKDYPSALAQYRKAERVKPGLVQAIFQGAAVLSMMNKRREARTGYQRVLKISRDHVQSLNNLAYLYAEDNVNLPEALRLASRADALAPGNGLILDTLGFVLYKNKKYDEGLKTLKKAAGLAPNDPSIYYHTALVLNGQGNRAQAVEDLQKALKLGDFPRRAAAVALLEKLKGGVRGGRK